MSVGLAGTLPAAMYDQEDDIDEAPYLWSDLLARRNALSYTRFPQLSAVSMKPVPPKWR